jgi:hypothetical protein
VVSRPAPQLDEQLEKCTRSAATARQLTCARSWSSSTSGGGGGVPLREGGGSPRGGGDLPNPTRSAKNACAHSCSGPQRAQVRSMTIRARAAWSSLDRGGAPSRQTPPVRAGVRKGERGPGHDAVQRLTNTEYRRRGAGDAGSARVCFPRRLGGPGSYIISGATCYAAVSIAQGDRFRWPDTGRDGRCGSPRPDGSWPSWTSRRADPAVIWELRDGRLTFRPADARGG